MSKKQLTPIVKTRKIFLNNLNSWMSNFIIEEFRTDHLPNSAIQNVFMGTVNNSTHPLPRLFSPTITKIKTNSSYDQEVFSNDIFIYSLEKGNLDEIEYIIKGLKAIKYEEEKVLIIISSPMTWRNTPQKTKTTEESNAVGFNEEEYIPPEEEKEELLEEEKEIDIEKEKNAFLEELNKKLEEEKMRKNKKKSTKKVTISKEDPKNRSKSKKKTTRKEEKPIKKVETPKETELSLKSKDVSPVPTESHVIFTDKYTPTSTQTNHVSTLPSNGKIYYYNNTEFSKRKSNQKYLPYKRIEDFALANSNPMLKVYIICPGYIYGCGEDFFFDYFRMAWIGEPDPIPIIGDGLNCVPTIHILDLVQVIKKLIEDKPITRYVVAIDKTKNRTLKNILKSISKSFGKGNVSTIDDFDIDAVNIPNYNEMSIDLKIKASNFIINETKMKNETDDAFNNRKFKWHCEYGIPANLDLLRYEFCLYRDLHNTKIIICGPPSSGKTTLSKSLSQQYNLPHITLKEIIEIAKRKKNALGDDIRKKYKEIYKMVWQAEEDYNNRKNKKKNDPPFDPAPLLRLPDDYIVRIVKERIMEGDCLSKGFILDGYPKTYEDAEALFKEGEKMSQFRPDSVIYISNMTEEKLKERVKSIPDYDTKGEEIDRRFNRRYKEYKDKNETEGNKKLLEFFSDNRIDIFNYDEELMNENEEEFKDNLKLYLNRNGDINSTEKLKDDERISPAEIKFNTMALEELKAVQEKKVKTNKTTENPNKDNSFQIDDEDYKEVEQIESNTLNKIKELSPIEQKLLEKKSEVLRRFLNERIIPLVSKGILQITKEQPDDPVEALADFLFESTFPAPEKTEENKVEEQKVELS